MSEELTHEAMLITSKLKVCAAAHASILME